MKNTSNFAEYHRIISPLIGLAICMALMPGIKGADSATTAGAPQTTTLAEQFGGETLSVSDSTRAGRFDIYISQWSSDAEVQRLGEALKQADADSLLTLLHDQHRRVGVVLMPGIQAHGQRARTRTPRNLLFARQVMTPSGRQIIAIADEHLGLGEPALDARKVTSEFNLIDIRFGADGKGVGKVVSAADVTFSAKTGLIEVKDFAAHPPRLIDIRAQKP